MVEVGQKFTLLFGEMCSPSALSFRFKSWSHNAPQGRSVSWSPARQNEPPKNKQEEHSCTDTVDVVFWIWDMCGLPPALFKGRKMRGFHAGLDPDDQPSFYCLPVGDI